MDLITCDHAHPYTARPDGLFACSCGELLAAADIEPETGQVWTVDTSGSLVLLADPRTALESAQDALRDLQEAEEYPSPSAVRQHAVQALQEALEVLREAAAYGVTP
ncbi:hypothetical protein AB0E77_30325 [Streptomyces sp. NPDC032940]|uniref:hypothetical protein n=1 Tax=Streptomyces sp. NPDC032940 TaxID=3155366 RepID=UPI00340CC10F